MKYNSLQNNFSHGELSQLVKGRVDLEAYFKGAEELTNFLPMKQGGVTFRPGTAIAEHNFGTALQTDHYAMFEFSPRDNENYIVGLNPSAGTPAIGNQIKIIRPGVTDSTTITKASYIWNKRPDFANVSTWYDPLGTLTVARNLQVVTQGDVMLVFDGTGILAPVAIIRTSENTFVVDSVLDPSQIKTSSGLPWLSFPVNSFEYMRHAFLDTNIDDGLRLLPSAVSGNITITAENAAGTDKDYFAGDVVGMYIKITHGASTGVAWVTSKVSDKIVNAQVIIAFGAATASSNWQVSAWTAASGYPRCGAFFEGRLVLGGSPSYPDTIWSSRTGNIYHFMAKRLAQDITTDVMKSGYFGPVVATDPFSFIPASQSANSIQWMYPADTLLIGTTSEEFSISGGSEQALSVSSIFVKAISSHGGSRVQPIRVGSSVIFVSFDGRRLLEIPKRLAEYTAAGDLTSLSEGILDKAMSLNTGLVSPSDVTSHIIQSICYQEEESTIWCLVNKFGASPGRTGLISFTYDKTSKTNAWAKHYIQGSVFISSICTVKGTPGRLVGAAKRLFLFHKRENSLYYSLEFLTRKNSYDTLIFGSANVSSVPTIYMDGAQDYYSGSQVGADFQITLVARQANAFPTDQTFSVFSFPFDAADRDYVYRGEIQVISGVITIPAWTHTAFEDAYMIGAKYEGQIVTMPSEAGAQFGVAQGSARRGHEISIFTDRSLGGKYKAKKAVNEFPVVGSKGGLESLYTGEIKLSLNASPDDTQIVIKQTEPYPFTVLWLLTKGYTYDV